MANPTPTPTPKVTCKDVIDAANKALSDKDRALQLKDLAIKDCGDKNAGLQTTVDQDNKKLSSIWANPYAMILLGAFAGAVGFFVIDQKVRK